MIAIDHIVIHNFRSLKTFDMDLDGGAFLTGMNGSGKTSVLEAIRFALLGYCEQTDHRGAGAKALVLEGAKEATIDLKLLGDHEPRTVIIHAVIPASAKASTQWYAENWENGKIVASKPEQLWSWMGVSEKILAAALLPAEHITTQGFGGLLAELQVVEIDLETFKATCGKKNFGSLNMDYPAIGSDGISHQSITLDFLKRVGEEAYEWRRAAGRTVKQLEAKLADQSVSVPTKRDGSPFSIDDLPTAQKALQDLSGKRDRLLQEIGEARQLSQKPSAGTVQELQKILTVLTEEKENAVVSIQEIENQTKPEVQIIRRQLNELEAHIAFSEKQTQALTEQLDGYEVGKPCEMCGVKWTEARVKKATSKLRASRLELSEQIKTDKTAAARLSETLKKAEAETENLQKKLSLLSQKEISLDSDIANIQEQIQTAQQISETQPLEELERDLVALDDKLKRGRETLEQLNKIRELETFKTELQFHQARYADMDWRVKAFRDGEVLNKLGGDKLQEFVQQVNATLATFGYVYGLEVEGKSIIVKLAREGEELRYIERASSGERKLVELAIALTFARETGLALIDDLDHLDGRARNRALSEIKGEVQGDWSDIWIVQIVAAGAWGKTAKPDNLQEIFKGLAPLKPIWIDGNAEGKQQEEAA